MPSLVIDLRVKLLYIVYNLWSWPETDLELALIEWYTSYCPYHMNPYWTELNLTKLNRIKIKFCENLKISRYENYELNRTGKPPRLGPFIMLYRPNIKSVQSLKHQFDFFPLYIHFESNLQFVTPTALIWFFFLVLLLLLPPTNLRSSSFSCFSSADSRKEITCLP